MFFASESQIKVGDFGFSTHSRGNMLDTFCGSPPYAAPELFADNCYQGELVDIWAMGVMLYYMLSGVMPFRGETIPQLKAKILEGKFVKLDFLTPVCQDLIAGLLTKETDERFIMEDIYSSMWLRTGSTAMELNPSKKSLLTSKTHSRSKLPILSRENGVVDSSATGSGSMSALDVSFETDSDSTPDGEVLQSMEGLGVPIADNNLLIGEPRNAIAGTYRILLHRKQLLKLTPEGQEREHSAIEPQERRKKLSSCSMGGGGQPLASESPHSPGSGGSGHKHKSGRAAKKNRKQQETNSKHMSKICVIL